MKEISPEIVKAHLLTKNIENKQQKVPKVQDYENETNLSSSQDDDDLFSIDDMNSNQIKVFKIDRDLNGPFGISEKDRMAFEKEFENRQQQMVDL